MKEENWRVASSVEESVQRMPDVRSETTIGCMKQAGTNHRALMLHDEIEKKVSGGRVDRKLVGESHAKLGLK